MKGTVLHAERDIRFEDRNPQLPSRRMQSCSFPPHASADRICGPTAESKRSLNLPRWVMSTAESWKRSGKRSGRSSPASS